MPSAPPAQTLAANDLLPFRLQAPAIRRSSHCEPPLLVAWINLSHALRNLNLNRNLTPSSSPANVIWTAAAKRSVDAALAASRFVLYCSLISKSESRSPGPRLRPIIFCGARRTSPHPLPGNQSPTTPPPIHPANSPPAF